MQGLHGMAYHLYPTIPQEQNMTDDDNAGHAHVDCLFAPSRGAWPLHGHRDRCVLVHKDCPGRLGASAYASLSPMGLDAHAYWEPAPLRSASGRAYPSRGSTPLS